jgi:hypothetical protein
MTTEDFRRIHSDIVALKTEIRLLRERLEERELSDWAKNELSEGRKVPKEDLIPLSTVRKRLSR